MHGISWVGSSESGTSRIVVMLGTEVYTGNQCSAWVGTTMGHGYNHGYNPRTVYLLF